MENKTPSSTKERLGVIYCKVRNRFHGDWNQRMQLKIRNIYFYKTNNDLKYTPRKMGKIRQLEEKKIAGKNWGQAGGGNK